HTRQRVVLNQGAAFVAGVWRKGRISMQKESVKEFTRVVDQLHVFPDAEESAAHSAPDLPSDKSGGSKETLPSAPQRLSWLRGMPKELERYYAKPGEAEWGC